MLERSLERLWKKLGGSIGRKAWEICKTIPINTPWGPFSGGPEAGPPWVARGPPGTPLGLPWGALV